MAYLVVGYDLEAWSSDCIRNAISIILFVIVKHCGSLTVMIIGVRCGFALWVYWYEVLP